MEIRGKIALVTGSAKRVGKAIALALAQRGAHVVVHYNTSTVQAEEAAAQIRLLGVEAVPLQADLADPVQVGALFEAVTDHFGRLDVLSIRPRSTTPRPLRA
jgi:NAD(P)-dependent dehydrogenase (short-subunit alcohol dehydrogenase family)